MTEVLRILNAIKKEVEQMKPENSMKLSNPDRRCAYEWAKADFYGILLKYMEEEDGKSI